MAEAEVLTLPAADIAEAVRAGRVTPRAVLAASLAQIERLNPIVGAFEVVRAEKALAEAEALEKHSDLGNLPLAGVPTAIKDNVPVAAEPARNGSKATPSNPQTSDHEVVRRLREAGAVVVGITRMSEFGVWGMTDNAFGTARNPWNLDRTTGGSSGGAAAAVASAMVPVAHGTDGLGSIRIPSACCGLFGIKPGLGTVPAGIGKTSWFGWSENGVLATTVRDAALVLSVMAGDSSLRDPPPLERGLRLGVSMRSPLVGVNLDPEFRAAVHETARLLSAAGHHVTRANIPYSTRNFIGGFWWYPAAVAQESEDFDLRALEPRTRAHAAIGRTAQRLRLIKRNALERWRSDVEQSFEPFDLLLTPMLLRTPPGAEGWHRRGWSRSMATQIGYAPFAAWWILVGYPAASVPAGEHSEGVPLAVQLVGRPGSEGLILSVAKVLEELRPWRRHAPLADAGYTGRP